MRIAFAAAVYLSCALSVYSQGVGGGISGTDKSTVYSAGQNMTATTNGNTVTFSSSGGDTSASETKCLQTGLIGEWKLDEGLGRFLFNNVYAHQPNVNFAVPGTVALSNYWSTVGGTLTDSHSENPWGQNSACTLHLDGGGYTTRNFSGLFTNGVTYTISAWLKSTTTNTFFRMANNGVSYSSNKLCTTDWKRYSHTWTAEATTGYILPIGTDDTGSNVFDALVWGLQCEVGTLPTMVLPQYYHMHLGNAGWTTTSDPTWSSSGLYFTNTTCYASGASDQPITFQHASIYVLARRSSLALPLASYAPLIGSGGTAAGGLQLYGSGVSSAGKFVLGGGTLEGGGTMEDKAWHVFGATYDGATMRTYVDDLEVGASTVSQSDVGQQTVYELMLGNLNNAAYWAGDIAYASIYNVGHTPTQFTNNVGRIHSIVSDRVTWTNTTHAIALEGDSIMLGLYPAIVTNSTPRQIRNFATSGASAETVSNRTSSVAAMYKTGRSKHIYCILLGANDLNAEVSDPTNFVAQLKNQCSTMRSAGWSVLASTLLPGTNTGFQARREIANTLILADTSFYDGIVRVDTNALMGATATNLTYWNEDGVHPSATGYATLAPMYKAAIEELLQ